MKTGHGEKHADEISPKFKKWIYILLALFVVADFFVHREHPAFFWDHIPGFSALYALIATVVIVIVVKGIGHAFLMKEEDYYHE
jgi:hypothetical protein